MSLSYLPPCRVDSKKPSRQLEELLELRGSFVRASSILIDLVGMTIILRGSPRHRRRLLFPWDGLILTQMLSILYADIRKTPLPLHPYILEQVRIVMFIVLYVFEIAVAERVDVRSATNGLGGLFVILLDIKDNDLVVPGGMCKTQPPSHAIKRDLCARHIHRWIHLVLPFGGRHLAAPDCVRPVPRVHLKLQEMEVFQRARSPLSLRFRPIEAPDIPVFGRVDIRAPSFMAASHQSLSRLLEAEGAYIDIDR